MKTFNKYFSQSGRTILEIMAVMSILGIITSGVFVMASKVFEKRNTNNVVEKIETYVQDIKDAFAWVDSYDFSSALNNSSGSVIKNCSNGNTKGITCYLKTEKIIKGIDNNGQIVTSGGTITFDSGKVCINKSCKDYSDFLGTFTIIASDISTQTCIALLNHDWGDDIYDYSTDIKLNTSFPTTTTQTVTALPPLSVSEANKKCTGKTIIQLKFK